MKGLVEQTGSFVFLQNGIRDLYESFYERELGMTPMTILNKDMKKLILSGDAGLLDGLYQIQSN